MRKLLFLPIITLLLICSCGDRNSLDILHGAGPYLGENTVHRELPPEVWEMLQISREKNISVYEYFKSRQPAEHWEANYREKYEAELIRVNELKELEEAYYNRYIDADGIAIIGHEYTHDAFFVVAKYIVLLMTSKRPELRDALRGNSFHVIDRIGLDAIPGWNNNVFWGGTATSVRRSLSRWPTIWIHISWSTVYPRSNPGQRNVDSEPMQIFVHEFVHVLESVIDRHFDPDFDHPPEIAKTWHAYNAVKDKNFQWTARGPGEYFAELAEVWFFHIGTHERALFETYEELQAVDPLGYVLMDEWFAKISFIPQSTQSEIPTFADIRSEE
jgi:hypothetical protein